MQRKTATGKIVLGLLGTALWLVPAGVARADVGDTRSLAMGGATAANSMGTAFAPMYNPAAVSGQWSMMLPGLTAGVGNNVLSFTEIAGLSSSFRDPVAGIGALASKVNLTQGLRLEANLLAPVIGYTGHPTPLKLMGEPVDFGFNVWGHGGASISLTGTAGLQSVIGSAPTILQNVTTLQNSLTSVSGLQSQVNSLVSNIQTNPAGAVSSAESTINSVVSSIDTLGKTVDSLNTALGPLASDAQRMTVTGVADGHLTMAVSGKAHVFKNDRVDVSVGLNLKSFIMPAASVVVTQLPSNLFGAGQDLRAQPMGVVAEVNTKPLTSLAKVSTAIGGAKQVITDAQKAVTSLQTAAQAATTALGGGDLAGLQAAQQQVTTAGTTLQNSATQLTSQIASLSTIQTDVTNDLAGTKMTFSQYSDVSPVGFGADLGVMAQIGNEWTAGLALENPIVLWPSKRKVTEFALGLNGFTGTPKPDESANYNLSEPTALRLGGSYRPDRVTGLTVAADVEQVFNGRPLAVHAGAEYVVARILPLRAGVQFGGLGTMVTAGAGLNLGPFHVDLGGGFGGTTGAGLLSMSLAI